MINIIKSSPPPVCLDREKKKVNGSYRCGDVIKRLTHDFFNKCYLCECEAPTSINVEHFRPHKGDKNLKFDWDNLFLACYHCNQTKGDRYNDILNCTKAEHDVVNWIKYEMVDDSYKGEVKLTALEDKKIVVNTVQLLKAIYNGTTEEKQAESKNIRKILSKELARFQRYLLEYYKNVEDDRRGYYYEKIKKHLKKSSAFTAFKRWIIKTDPALKQEFEQYFD
jgi:uncharacterized protein (TIGR02646 family)